MKHKVIYLLPNGREVREDENGFHVQPPHDNCWINGATVEEALTESGWLKVPEEHPVEAFLAALPQEMFR